MKASRWRSASLAALLLGALASPALAQFCADPISPLCCPSPCPVFDATRVPKLLADVEDLGESVGLDAQIVQTATQVGQSIGDAKAAATTMSQQLSSFTATLSNEVTAVQNGLSTNPVQALAGVKQSLFEPAGSSSTVTQMASRLSARIAAAQGEQAAAFAVSLMRSTALPSLVPQQSQLVESVTGAEQLQSDMVANSASRLALYQDVGAIHQLVSAWVAQCSMQAAMRHPASAGDMTASPATTTSGSAQSSASSPSSSQAVASTVDQLVALHDARVTAQTVLSTYPALQQTVASATLAGQFASDAESALRQTLSNTGLSASSLPDVEKALTAIDSTGWLDVAKTGSAQQAASKVTVALLASGGLSQTDTGDGSADIGQMQTAMTSWLDASKQSRYWAVLASQAQQSIATLDGTLGGLSDRVGVDVTGATAASSEKALLAKLSANPGAGPWRAVLVAAAQDPSAHAVLKYAGTP